MQTLLNTIAAVADTTAETAATATEAVVETVEAVKSVGLFGKIKEHGLLIGGTAAGVAIVSFAGYKLGKKYAKSRAAKKTEPKAEAK
jgi:hypothetical protein